LFSGGDGFDFVQANVSNDESAAWPVANPIVTCASVSDAGFPSNFVADPFLFIQVTCSCLPWFHHVSGILDSMK
jgi:hypothetical protein